MQKDQEKDSFVLRRYLAMAIKNLRRRPVRTALTVAGVALAVTVAVSLGGFMLGYRGAIDRSINMLGFQVMIMAKGCPYEAATMMLKGGTGLLYLPGDTYQKVKNDGDTSDCRDGLAKTWRMDGIDVAIGRGAGTIFVSHRPIGNYVAAMAMTFRLEDASELEGLFPGERRTNQAAI